MADRINVCRDGKAIYDIVLTQSFDGLKEAVSCLPVKEHKICIVMDSNVAPLYLEEVRAVLAGCCKSVLQPPLTSGELTLFRSRPPSFRRWIPVSAVRPAWTLMPIKTW